MIISLIDKFILKHFLKNKRAPRHRPVSVFGAAIGFGCLGQDREKCHFGDRKLTHVFGEIGACRRLNAEAVTAKRYLIEVKLHDLLLGQRRFNPLGKDRFLNLANIAHLVGQQQVFGDLLRDR